MIIGKADRRILIERATYAANSYGEQVATWSTLATVWAELVKNRGTEKIEGTQDTATHSVTFKVRSSSTSRGFKADDRLTYSGKVYDITGIEEVGRNHELLINCKTTTT